MSNPQAILDATTLRFSRDIKNRCIAEYAILYPARVANEGELSCPTAGTDGIEIIFDNDYLLNESENTLDLTILHEHLHNVLLHSGNFYLELCKAFGAEIANKACDYEVNAVIVAMGHKLGKDWLYDAKYKGMTAWDIALTLKKENQGQPQQGQPQQGGTHEKLASANPQQAQQAQDKGQLAQKQVEAMRQMDTSNKQDKGLDSMGALIEASRAKNHAPRDWREDLREFFGEVKAGDFKRTWSIPSKIRLRHGFKMGRMKKSFPKIGIILDSSGSMRDILPKIIVELESLNYDGYQFSVICCDGEVSEPQYIDKGEFDYSSLEIRGGGGSNMVPAFEAFAQSELCEDCQAIIFFTDGEIDYPSKDIMELLPPVLLVEYSKYKSKEGNRFYKHIHIKGN